MTKYLFQIAVAVVGITTISSFVSVTAKVQADLPIPFEPIPIPLRLEEEGESQKPKLIQFPILPHHEVIRRRERERRAQRQRRRGLNRNDSSSSYYDYDVNATLEVGGLFQGYGTHYVDLWVGTPPQRQTVIVDTGSGVTAFPCQSCSDCGSKYHVDAYFQESKSSSFHKFTCDQCVGARCSTSSYNSNDSNAYCHLSVSYQEGSMWDAYQANDVTYVGGMHDQSITSSSGSGTGTGNSNAENGEKLHGLLHGEDPKDAPDFTFDMTFGCQTKITGLFKTQLVSIINSLIEIELRYYILHTAQCTMHCNRVFEPLSHSFYSLIYIII